MDSNESDNVHEKQYKRLKKISNNPFLTVFDREINNSQCIRWIVRRLADLDDTDKWEINAANFDLRFSFVFAKCYLYSESNNTLWNGTCRTATGTIVLRFETIFDRRPSNSCSYVEHNAILFFSALILFTSRRSQDVRSEFVQHAQLKLLITLKTVETICLFLHVGILAPKLSDCGDFSDAFCTLTKELPTTDV